MSTKKKKAPGNSKKTLDNGRKKTITRKNSTFLDLLVSTSNLTQSWIGAGYSKKGACQSARATLKKSHINKEYKRRLKAVAKKVNFDAEDVLNELGKIAFANSEDYIDWHEVEVETKNGMVTVSKAYLKPGTEVTRDMKAAISGVKETNNGIELKFHNKENALDSLKKYFGIDNPKEIDKARKIKAVDGQDETKEGTTVNFNFSVVNEDNQPANE